MPAEVRKGTATSRDRLLPSPRKNGVGSVELYNRHDINLEPYRSDDTTSDEALSSTEAGSPRASLDEVIDESIKPHIKNAITL